MAESARTSFNQKRANLALKLALCSGKEASVASQKFLEFLFRKPGLQPLRTLSDIFGTQH
jgi:hypothetical protein